MSNIIFTKQTVDVNTGQIIEQVNIKKEVKDSEQFIRMYTKDLAALFKCNGAELSVIMACMDFVDYNTNELFLTSGRRKAIQISTNYSINTINVAISRLYKKNIFIKDSVGKTYLNPKLFFYGSDLERTKMFNLNISYEIKE